MVATVTAAAAAAATNDLTNVDRQNGKSKVVERGRRPKIFSVAPTRKEVRKRGEKKWAYRLFSYYFLSNTFHLLYT
jgi:hypothetical protein